jgi:hypothetical protein
MLGQVGLNTIIEPSGSRILGQGDIVEGDSGVNGQRFHDKKKLFCVL